MLERRYERRASLRLLVKVRDREGSYGWYATRDVAPQGLFVEASRGAPDLNESVQVALPWSVTDGAEPTLTGVVVHRGHDGFGIMLAQPLMTPRPAVPLGP